MIFEFEFTTRRASPLPKLAPRAPPPGRFLLAEVGRTIAQGRIGQGWFHVEAKSRGLLSKQITPASGDAGGKLLLN